jgi:hypothetical protein
MKIPTLYLKTRILFLFTLLCAAIATVHADTFTVQSTGDGAATSANCPGAGCRLRDALAAVNDGDTINFAVTGTITLSSGQLVVDKHVTIDGPGADQLSVDANHNSRVFSIASGKTVTIDGLTITNGLASGMGTAGVGGGIFNDHATLTVSNCTLSGNSAGNGGGIFNLGDFFGTATLTVSNCTLSGNSGSGGGGGIFNDGVSFGSATLTVSNSTLSGNSGTGDTGGGILNNGDSNGTAPLTVSNSTLSGNSASSGGGGIFNNHATLDITNTILNAGAQGGNISNNSGTVTSHGYNLSSDSGGGLLTATGDQINTDPKLGPLQDNGGPTYTHALLSCSPAIDGGDPSFTPPPNYDQRGAGYPRVMNGRLDIGSFEVQEVLPCYSAQVQQPINADGTSVFNVRRGVVPVKFTLTVNGVATCNLPPATIALTRTAGGTTGSIDESVYTGSADTGSNFRISSCQYIYNLSASALGAGTYRVDIIINGQVVGSATFTLR